MTTLIARLRDGDSAASGRLLSLVYDELRGLAGHMFRGQPGDHTLQPTALVNEACLRLMRSSNGWNDRRHLMNAAAQAMRQLLADHARARRAERRGGGEPRWSIAVGAEPAAAGSEVDLVALDDVLEKLARTDARLSRIFELRFLVGLSVQDTADLMELSPRTIELDTQLLRAWLQRELNG
ncbi:MAG: ECF-type sigma factor [Phycisphaerales bacterium]